MGLTNEQIAIIKSTVPILETGGETLTKHFYKSLFAEHPEVKVFFNQAHQVSGTQPRALANSVLQYAKHIDEPLSSLGDLPSQIIQKHVSLNIPAEGYPIVGVTLLKAIREVLGEEIATDAVLDAWKAAYFQLADILIAAEESVYASRAAAPGGWRGKRSFILWKKQVETKDHVTSFYFKPKDGKAILDFEPGQYLALSLIIDGNEIRRTYSLSDSPNGEYYRISVKREENGVASKYLHDNVHEGCELDIFPPAGHFVLTPSSKPLVLISSGIGLTPVLSMLNHTLQKDTSRQVTFIHFARNHTQHAFHDHIQDLSRRHSNLNYYFAYTQPGDDDDDAAAAAGADAGAAVDADHGDHHSSISSSSSDATLLPKFILPKPHHIGHIDANILSKWLPVDTRDIDVYFLGTKSFMSSTKFLLKQAGVPENQAKYEFFGPSEALQTPTCPFASGANTPGATCPFSRKAA